MLIIKERCEIVHLPDMSRMWRNSGGYFDILTRCDIQLSKRACPEGANPDLSSGEGLPFLACMRVVQFYLYTRAEWCLNTIEGTDVAFSSLLIECAIGVMGLRMCPQAGRQWLMAVGRLLLGLLLLMSGLLLLTRMPGVSYRGPLPELSLDEREISGYLETHVRALADEIGERNIWTYSSMKKSAQYIEKVLTRLDYAVQREEFSSHGVKSYNLEATIAGATRPDEIIVVGAHYDTVAGCPGANDNASGVAAVLELARLLKNRTPDRTIRLVAFANEEPPFFTTGEMGSLYHARKAKQQQQNIKAMLSLETIGYYSDRPGSQQYPFPFSIFYPDTGNFIGFVGNIRSLRLVRKTVGSFRNHVAFPAEGLAAPSFVTGVGWSDHWSFWQQGYPAIMVTDTAFFRYSAYHTPADTFEKLNYERLARVVGGLVPTIIDLATVQ